MKILVEQDDGTVHVLEPCVKQDTRARCTRHCVLGGIHPCPSPVRNVCSRVRIKKNTLMVCTEVIPCAS